MPRRRTRFVWPKRAHTERRLWPRVRVRFPAHVAVSADEPELECDVLDLGVGGVKLVLDRYVELFTRMPVAFGLPIERRDGTIDTVIVRATGVVVRIEPDEPAPEVTAHETGMALTGIGHDDERALAMFLLQRLQHDPETELLR